MSYVHVSSTTMKLETLKLDNPGYVKSYGGMQNNPERLRRLTHRVEFSQSLNGNGVLEQQDMAHAKAALGEEVWKWPQRLKLTCFKRIMM
jgi:hypothetical protein